ncbi:MAG TPA: MBL fold metallo-hydrolase [Acetobacteraceae bacterium]|jgi:L-ascorbate metabolism protein UlaG (beta-lactamase superfamily)|nr:MBL fold metallo-hydrolase [Acetobacteraceae bacterium]
MALARICILSLLALFAPRLAEAGCAPIALGAPRVVPADAAPDTLTITFLGHASFLIETPDGVRAVTDYNGYNVPRDPPDIATMNHAHSTHYTDFPDPRIRHVLRGWRDDGAPAQIDLTVRDLHVANLPTNIRDGQGGTEVYGNSIFLFESAGLCIAHLSHLHHLLTEQDLVLLGHIDVVMAPVDGVFTMSQPDMVAVLDQMHPRLVLPMHYFMRDVVARFVDLVRDRYAVRFNESPTLLLSRATLPERPTIVVLPGGF